MSTRANIDINPQTIKFKLTQGAADAIASVSTEVPQNLFGTGRLAIEILKIDFFLPFLGTTAVSTVGTAEGFLLSEALTASHEPNSNQVVGYVSKAFFRGAANADTYLGTSPITLNVTDQAGNGIIYVNSKLWFGLKTDNQSAAQSAWCTVHFRWKSITASDLAQAVQQFQ